MVQTELTELLGVKYPIIMAPMFLVTSVEMMVSAGKAGIAGCLPAHNFRKLEDFDKALQTISDQIDAPFGVNLVVNKSHPRMDQELEICLKYPKVKFIYTTLGTPQKVINACKQNGVKVLCGVSSTTYAQKVESLGADAIVAVHSGSGGHAGAIPATILVPLLRQCCKVPIIAGGGIGTGEGILAMLAMGAEGVSIGSPFIATQECKVSKEYKQAIIDYKAPDIVLSSKISGTPCTVINTPYVKKIGTKQNFIEAFLNKNRKLKKYVKMLTFYKGMKLLEKAALSATYKTVWVAGPSIHFVNKISTVQEFVDRLIHEYEQAYRTFSSRNQPQFKDLRP